MKNNTIILQHCNSNSEMIYLLELTAPRHLRYCQFHEMDYYVTIGGDSPYSGGDWTKVGLIDAALDGYEYVIWIDADAVILDIRQDLRRACEMPVNVCEYDNPYKHAQVGVMYWHGGPAAKQLIQEWQATAPGTAPWWEQGTLQPLVYETHPDWCGRLPAEYNSVDFINPCTRPIVRAYHGYKSVQTRLERMRRDMANWKEVNPMVMV